MLVSLKEMAQEYLIQLPISFFKVKEYNREPGLDLFLFYYCSQPCQALVTLSTLQWFTWLVAAWAPEVACLTQSHQQFEASSADNILEVLFTIG